MYFAYSVRALSASLGPLDDRPAVGEDRELVRLAVLDEVELQQELVEAHRARSASSSPARSSKSSLLGGAVASPARRCGRTGVVVCVPCAPSSHSNLRAQHGQFALAASSGATLSRRLVFSQTSRMISSRLTASLLPGEQLDRLGRLVAGDDADDRAEHAGRLAGAGLARGRARPRTRSAGTASRRG